MIKTFKRLTWRAESGFTLGEVLTGMILTVAVTGVLVAGAITVYRGQRYTRQDSDSLGVLRTAVGRLERDLRQSRKLFVDSSARRIRFWVDTDKDNKPDPEERIVWELVTVGTEAELRRTTQLFGAPVVTVARDLVPQDAFSFNSTYTTVSFSFTADSIVGELSPEREVRSEVRLRNAAIGG